MFKSGNTKNLADPKVNTIVTLTLSVESLDKLNEIIDNGLKAGGQSQRKLLTKDLCKYEILKI
jgi:predicted lactoylglutathione lyase